AAPSAGAAAGASDGAETAPQPGTAGAGAVPGAVVPPAGVGKPKRFHGTVRWTPPVWGAMRGALPMRCMIAHLAGLVGSRVTVTLEIEAEVQAGVPDAVVRTVTENSRTLKLISHGFEAE